jgi:hypothetical protein
MRSTWVPFGGDLVVIPEKGVNIFPHRYEKNMYGMCLLSLGLRLLSSVECYVASVKTTVVLSRAQLASHSKSWFAVRMHPCNYHIDCRFVVGRMKKAVKGRWRVVANVLLR